MTPKVNYIVSSNGEKLFVQLPVKDWEKLMAEHRRLITEAKFKSRLRSAIKDSEMIRDGKKETVLLNDFLNEM